MSDINIQPQNIEQANPQQGGEILDNIKRLKSGDGSWRMEKGALIITDESGIDRVLIGYLKGGF